MIVVKFKKFHGMFADRTLQGINPKERSRRFRHKVKFQRVLCREQGTFLGREVKRALGLTIYDAPNATEESK